MMGSVPLFFQNHSNTMVKENPAFNQGVVFNRVNANKKENIVFVQQLFSAKEG